MDDTTLFSSLAKKYSYDTKTKYNGGIIGWLSEQDLVEISYEYVQVFDYNIGKISPLIWTKKGIHIVKVFDKKPESKFSFLEAKKFLKDQILNNLAKKKLINIINNRKNFLYSVKYYG